MDKDKGLKQASKTNANEKDVPSSEYEIPISDNFKLNAKKKTRKWSIRRHIPWNQFKIKRRSSDKISIR